MLLWPQATLVIWSEDPYAVDSALLQRMPNMTAWMQQNGLPQYLEGSMSADVVAAPDAELAQRSLAGRHHPELYHLQGEAAAGEGALSVVAIAAIAASAGAVALAALLGALAITRRRAGALDGCNAPAAERLAIKVGADPADYTSTAI